MGWGRASNLQRVSPKYRVGAKWNRDERVGFDGANEATEMTPRGNSMFRYGAMHWGKDGGRSFGIGRWFLTAGKRFETDLRDAR